MGPPEVRVDGAPLVVDTRKAIAVLAILATDGRPFARDEIAAMLWPESDDVAARGALRRTLSALKAGLGDGMLRIDRTRVELDRRRARIDIDVIEQASRSDDRPTLDAAVALARGSFMAGFNLRDSPEFDDWRAARATAVERSVLAIFDRLGTAAANAGDLAGAADAAVRRLALDPLDERTHVRLMDLYLSMGDRAAALRQYRVCVAVLERELGVVPLEATTARYEAIRDQAAPPPQGPPVASTPRRIEETIPLVARDAHLDSILRLHSEVEARGIGRVVALVGEAGIGKTRLADEASRRWRTEGAVVIRAAGYPAERGIAYAPIVDLLRAALAEPGADRRVAELSAPIRADLARLLPAVDPDGSAITSSADRTGSKARFLGSIAEGLTRLVAGSKPGAVWIDDVQWLDGSSLEALGFMVRRLGDRPIVLLLAWRAEDLDRDGIAFARRAAEHSGTNVVDLHRLGHADVVTLIGSTSRGATLDPASIERLVAASEGLPLYVVEALATVDDAATGAVPGGVATVLRSRIADVTEPAAQVLAAASVIGRSFDIATVRSASGRSEDEVVDAIDQLLRRRLIQDDGDRLDFVHGAVRALVLDAISLPRRRLLHRRVADALRRDVRVGGREDLVRTASIAYHEREAGRDAVAAEAYRRAGELAAALHANHEAIEHDQAALALGHPDAVGLHASIGALRTRLGDYAGAIAAFEAAASLASAADLPDLEAALGRTHLRRGDLAAADHHLSTAIASMTDDRKLARTLVDLSIVRRRVGDRSGATETARNALRTAVRGGDSAGQGGAHRMLGLLALDHGDARQAVGELRTAVEASDRDPDPTARIAALTGLALAEASAGEVEAGIQHGAEAADLCRQIGDRHLEGAVENHVADMFHAAGRDEEAMVHLRRAVEAFAEVGGDPADPDPGIWMLSAS
jgi:DNA-binding SARP family transcriptional activator